MAKKRTIKAKIGAAVVTLFALAVIGAVAYNITMNVQGKIPKYFGYACMQVVSVSMQPDIPVNSYIIIKQTDPHDLEVGDVITFYSRDESISGLPNTHKIAGISEQDGEPVFVTRGINNPVNDDSPVYSVDIIGRYICTVPLLSKIGGLLKSPFAILMILVVPAFILFALEIVSLKSRRKEADNAAEGIEEAGDGAGSDGTEADNGDDEPDDGDDNSTDGGDGGDSGDGDS